MKVIFFGTPDFVEPVIKALAENFELVKSFRNPKQLNNKAIEQLKSLNSDLFVVASYGVIFSTDFLNIPKYGILNIHPSLLPKYRGPTPVQTAILNGDKKTGVTIIKIDEKIDHGPILAQKEIEIAEDETSESLLKQTFELGAKILPDVISNYIKKEIKISPQDDKKATYTQHLTKENGYLGLESFKIENLKLKIDRMVRAYFPWPGVWFKTKLGDKKLIIKLLPNKKIQVEGKNPMTYKDFINGYSEGKLILGQLKIEN